MMTGTDGSEDMGPLRRYSGLGLLLVLVLLVSLFQWIDGSSPAAAVIPVECERDGILISVPQPSCQFHLEVGRQRLAYNWTRDAIGIGEVKVQVADEVVFYGTCEIAVGVRLECDTSMRFATTPEYEADHVAFLLDVESPAEVTFRVLSALCRESCPDLLPVSPAVGRFRFSAQRIGPLD